MWSRKRLEIGWLDLLYAAVACLRGRSAEKIAQDLARWWSPRDDALVCLSVRSGFDLWLQAAGLPAGSEILVSALTIPDMVRLIEAHGLLPVPIDVDPATLSVDPRDAERAITPRTRAILVAHLFGTRPDIDTVVQVARRHGLKIIEDCAQAFCGRHWMGHEQADVAMFSFGPIKTRTALGGALLRVDDTATLARMHKLQQSYGRQSRKQFLARVLKYAAFKVLSLRLPYACVLAWCRWRGRDPDELVRGSVRGFAGGDLLRAIRRRPSAPLVTLLKRRLMSFDVQWLRERCLRAALLRKRLADCVELPGEQCSDTTDWVFPVLCPDPARMVAELRAAGFDAARSHSLCVVLPPSVEVPPAACASEWLKRLVLLPCYAEMPVVEIERMADVVRRTVEAEAKDDKCVHDESVILGCLGSSTVGEQVMPHRKNFNLAGHAHELTFSCYHGYPFLKADRTCHWLAEAIDAARQALQFQLWAYVFMPEHVHLLVCPREQVYDIAEIRKAIKSPVAARAIKFIEREAPAWLPRITRQRGKRIERLFGSPVVDMIAASQTANRY